MHAKALRGIHDCRCAWIPACTYFCLMLILKSNTHWGSNEWKEDRGKKTKLMLFIVVFGLSHGCSGWWGFELYTTWGSISVFVCVGIWLTLVWWCICPVDRSQWGNQKRGSAREREDQMGDLDGLARLTGRCLWAIIYKLFNLGYFLALGNG